MIPKLMFHLGKSLMITLESMRDGSRIQHPPLLISDSLTSVSCGCMVTDAVRIHDAPIHVVSVKGPVNTGTGSWLPSFHILLCSQHCPTQHVLSQNPGELQLPDVSMSVWVGVKYPWVVSTPDQGIHTRGREVSSICQIDMCKHYLAAQLQLAKDKKIATKCHFCSAQGG